VILQLLKIVAAYLAASLVAGFIIPLGLALLGDALEGRWQDAMKDVLFALQLGLGASVAIAVFAFVPAVVFIAAAEVRSTRSAAYYGGAGAVVPIFLSLPGPLGLLSTAAFALMRVIAAGLISGLVYWRIAGRTAGAWRLPAPAQRKPPSSSQNPSLVNGHVSVDTPVAGSQAPPSRQT
jgi:hypothetical protein